MEGMGDITTLMKSMADDEKNYPVIYDTDKQNITLWENGDAFMKFEYYIRAI